MTSKEKMNEILDELQECGFGWQSMMWFRQELEELICIAKEEVKKDKEHTND